jgi:general stress protein 26
MPPPPADPPRPTAQRVRDTLARLAADVDVWVATASADGEPYLVPLSYLWHDGRIVMATSERTTTVRNLRRGGPVRLALDGLRDVVLIEGDVDLLTAGGLDPGVADAYATHAGWDPRSDPTSAWLAVTPTRIRAWREANELAGREVMRAGEWLAPAGAARRDLRHKSGPAGR